MYAIIGATGHVGRAIAHRLLNQNHPVRVLGRDRKRLRLFEYRGAQVCVGDVRDRAFLTQAFEGIKAAFVMIPPDLRAEDYRAHQDNVTDQVVRALRTSKVKYVVCLSSVGAHNPAIKGAVSGNRNMEQQLNELSGLNVVYLRPGYFMTNTLEFVLLLRERHRVVHALDAQVRLPWVAPCDIAKAGARALQTLDFKGVNTLELLGQPDLSMTEITRVLGLVLGIDSAQYVQAPWEARSAPLRQAGISDKTLATMRGSIELANCGALCEGVERTHANTTETSIEEWAEQTLGSPTPS